MAGMLNNLFKSKDSSIPRGSDKRRHSRRSCNEFSEYMTDTGKKIGCKIVDMSLGGLRITSFNGISMNDVVRFDTPAFTAQVVWVENQNAGLRFL